MDKLKNKIPLVRFPEFKADWEFIHGNELFTRISNKNHNSDLPILAISQEFGAIPRHLINYKISVTEKSVSSYKVVEKGDFIISLRSFQGGIEYSSYKGICSPAYVILRPTIELEAEFYKSHFKSFRYIQQLQSKLEGIRDGKMISYKYFSEIKLPFPTLPEQKKIAHFFSIVDQKLNQLQEKLNGLEQYKKGIMQQIFSQQLRFKDENKNGFPEWEEKKLGEVTKITAGGTPSTLRKDYWNGKIRWMNSGELNLKMVSEVENRITELGLKKSSAKLLPINCILIGLAGQGKTRGTIAINKVELCTNQSIGSIMPNPETYYSMFLYFNLDMRYEEIRRMSTGDGGRGGLNLKIIKDIKVNFPSIKEQTQIANFLSKIDNKINTINKQIERTKTYKKGVLQKMFV